MTAGSGHEHLLRNCYLMGPYPHGSISGGQTEIDSIQQEGRRVFMALAKSTLDSMRSRPNPHGLSRHGYIGRLGAFHYSGPFSVVYHLLLIL